MWLFRKKKEEPAPPRTDVVPIPKPVAIPEDAICFFDPFDFNVRKRSLGRLPQYSSLGTLTESQAHEVSEEELPQEGECAPAEHWEEEGGAAGAGSTTPTTKQQTAAAADGNSPGGEGNLPSDDELRILIEKERKAVADLRAVLELPEPTEEQAKHRENLSLLRFLRAREYKIPETADMYKKMLQWREENGIDGMLDAPDPHETMFQCICGHRNHGYSYEGHPVYYERTGLVKVAEMLKYCTEEDIIRRHVRFMEYAIRRCQYSSMANKRNVEKIVMIHDLAHLKFTIETVGVKIFTKTVTIDQNNYPERLHRVFIINAPLSFRGVWAVVKPFIDPKTAKKIKILGADFQASMLKDIPLSELPEMYGGNCRCEYDNGDHCVPWIRAFPHDDEKMVPEAWPKI